MKNTIVCPHCHKAIEPDMRYYCLTTTPIGNSYRKIYHNTFYTTADLKKPLVLDYIKGIYKNEYCSYFISWNEISEKEYAEAMEG